MQEIDRALLLAKKPKESFFLWGPRQTGKSYLLRKTYPETFYVDLLKTSEYIKYLEKPWLLTEELEDYVKDKTKGELATPIIIDEVQKVPMLLDEVHWLIENRGLKFILCGSSARKLKRGHANLLGGRAFRYELFGLSAHELKKDFNLIKILNAGYLPRHYLSSNHQRLLDSYVKDYLKEEIAEEALVRNLAAFSNFLRAAAFSDTEPVIYANIASDSAVSAKTAKEYFQILVDTLLGHYLPAYVKNPSRRIIQTPKFYFADVGVVNHLLKRKDIEPKTELFGKAFENWVFHELNLFNSYQEKSWDFSYWRLSTGVEVDFIINDMELAIEAKGKSEIKSEDLKGLRELIKDHPNIKKRIVVSLVDRDRITDDGIRIMGYKSFIEKLWAEEL